MKLPQPEIKKIALFRALQLGDLLCAVPAVRALSHAYPAARISLLGMPWSASFTERFSQYFDRFIHFPGYPGLPEQALDPCAFTAFLHRIQEEQFDLVLQMQGNGSIVNPMVELFGGRYTAGFCLANDYCPNQDLFLEYPEGIHEIERHLKLMEHLGIPSRGTDLEFPLTSKDGEQYEALAFPLQAQRYVCVHPGSRGAWRQWPTAHFAALADYCAEQGLQPVLTGTREELSIVEAVSGQMKAKPFIAAGKTGIGEVAILVKNAFALVSNCTGVSHLAAAFKTPSVVISMDGEPERWAPLNRTLHRTIDWLKTPDFGLVFGQLQDLLRGMQRNELGDAQVPLSEERIANRL